MFGIVGLSSYEFLTRNTIHVIVVIVGGGVGGAIQYRSRNVLVLVVCCPLLRNSETLRKRVFLK